MIDPRLVAALADHYRLERPLGAGGMATVFLAHDLKHDRPVAVKVLRPELAAVLGAERFVVEIRTTASLSHPHILPLFDSGTADGFLYYVMPYVEGETLRGMLDRETQLPVDEAVRIAVEVADALQYAHAHGVIHRDIKPENILMQGGRPMVADFGIALAVSAAAGGRMTETGLSLGTPHYMSPEQATAAKDITARSDVYSLGSVLYEMLSGNPPHVGATAQQIIMKIVTEDAAPVTQHRKHVPLHIAEAVEHALEKLPADRFSSARAFGEALQNPAYRTGLHTAASAAADPASGRATTNKRLVGLAMVAALALAAWGWLRPRVAPTPGVEFALTAPDSSRLAEVVLTPDGRRLVAELRLASGSALYARPLDREIWQLIPGTEGAHGPFISPDGKHVAFAVPSEGELRRVPIEGGAPTTVMPITADFFGGSWGEDGYMVVSTFTATNNPPVLLRVAAGGGEVRRLTGDTTGSWGGDSDPSVIDGGRAVLFTSYDQAGVASLVAMDVATRTRRPIGVGMSPKLGPRGTLLFVAPGGRLVEQEFDRRRFVLKGDPVTLADGLPFTYQVLSIFSTSSSGVLLIQRTQRSGSSASLQLVSRDGVPRPLLASPNIAHPRFSPDGRRIAYIVSETGDRGDVWIHDVQSGSTQRLTFEGQVADPAWSRDGRWVAYSSVGKAPGSRARLFRRAADGSGDPELLADDTLDLWQVGFVPGGREIYYRSGNDLQRAPIGAGRAVPLLKTPFMEEHPAVSPDGKWIAYKSNETGSLEIFVRHYPEMGPRTIVSLGGGETPAWSDDGRTLYYWRRGKLAEVTLRFDGDRAVVASRAELFSLAGFQAQANRNFDLRPGGREFVFVGGPTLRTIVRIPPR